MLATLTNSRQFTHGVTYPLAELSFALRTKALPAP